MPELLDDLNELLRIPSISAGRPNPNGIQQAADTIGRQACHVNIAEHVVNRARGSDCRIQLNADGEWPLDVQPLGDDELSPVQM